MAYQRRAKRDGTGPYKGSYQRGVYGGVGRRRRAGRPCPRRTVRRRRGQ